MKIKRRIVGHRCEGKARESGFALLGTLSVVIVLGVMVAVALATLQPKATPSGTTLAGATTTTVPKNAATGAQEAAISACQADFQAISTAISEYRALQGNYPPAGTAWATSSANGGPLLQTWPSQAQYFALTWNGAILSVVPARGVVSHGSAGTSSPVTGCFAA